MSKSSSRGGACRYAQLFLMTILALLSVALPLSAQSKRKTPTPSSARQPKSERAQAAEALTKSREEFVRVTNEYKKSLEQLLSFYEKDVAKAEARVVQMKALYADGLISRLDLEKSESAVTTAKAMSAETRERMLAADRQVAEMLVEAQAAEQMAKAPPLPKGKLVRTASYIRYGGAGGWSLSNAGKVQSFFVQKFGRQLPVSTFGQSGLHDRWGLDHRNAMDVGINPDSTEGQALSEFLRANGIPFSAFRGAIPGVATGPHFHIGMPSHRTTAPSPTR
jgi:hypothetical protein